MGAPCEHQTRSGFREDWLLGRWDPTGRDGAALTGQISGHRWPVVCVATSGDSTGSCDRWLTWAMGEAWSQHPKAVMASARDCLGHVDPETASWPAQNTSALVDGKSTGQLQRPQRHRGGPQGGAEPAGGWLVAPVTRAQAVAVPRRPAPGAKTNTVCELTGLDRSPAVLSEMCTLDWGLNRKKSMKPGNKRNVNLNHFTLSESCSDPNMANGKAKI